MNATINEILLPIFLFVLYFCIASILYTSANGVTEIKPNITSQHQLTAACSVDVDPTGGYAHSPKGTIQFDNFYTQVKELFQEEKIDSLYSSVEVTIPEFKEEKITEIESQVLERAEVKEITQVKPINNFYIQTEGIMNNLTKRQSRKLFKPLEMKIKSNGVEKSLTVTKAEILKLFQQDPEKVITVLQQQLPELFTTETEIVERTIS
jgi:hypothetical protein